MKQLPWHCKKNKQKLTTFLLKYMKCELVLHLLKKQHIILKYYIKWFDAKAYILISFFLNNNSSFFKLHLYFYSYFFKLYIDSPIILYLVLLSEIPLIPLIKETLSYQKEFELFYFWLPELQFLICQRKVTESLK